MTDTSNGDNYYTASEVAKIRGIRRQSVIDGCKRGQYPGAYKTPPDSTNRQGVWKIPKAAIIGAIATEDIIPLTRPLTPNDLQTIISQAVNQAVDKRLQRLEDRLESHDKLLMETIRSMQQRKEETPKKPWYKFWG